MAIRIRRSAFDDILREAVHSAFMPEVYPTPKDWQEAVANSSVRLQFDPDHHPSGAKLERRAIQLGLRGEFLVRYARDWIVGIEDISEFVAAQRVHATEGECRQLVTPREEVYAVVDKQVVQKLGVDPFSG